MKLTVRETKKAIKNNQTVKFTLERNNARELTSNKKYYKRYVKAIVKTVKSFYPALDSSYILSELERYEILPNISRFDEEGYLIRYGKQRYVTAQTFEVSDDKIYWVNFDYNADYFIVDEYLGMKLDSDVAVTDPYTNHFSILVSDPSKMYHITDNDLPLYLILAKKSNGTFNIAVDETVFAGTKSKMMSLDKQNFVRKEYAEEIKNIQNKIVEANKVITPLYEELTTKFNDKVIKSQKVVSSKIVRTSFDELSTNLHKSISKKLGLRLDDYFIALSYEIRWLGVESVLKHN